MAEVNIAKTYDPKEFEDKLYEKWEEKGYFTPEVDKTKKPYTIMMPPPNITGQLHLGHALDGTLQDFLIRTKRMQGYSTLWLPGEDHASIATEVKVEKSLLEQGLHKKEMGREAFLEKVWDWAYKYRDRIKTQYQKLGISADYTRERFTMDEGLNKAVRKVFVELYNEGLIYKGNRIVNWCPKCQTAISDAEIEYEEQNGHFWHIKYPVVGSDEFLEIATTRPETLLGDTAVAVNPNDERYSHLIGKTLMLPIVNREIPIVADEYVDLEFGTGAVKITPAHDPNDYEVGKRHDLPQIVVLNKDGSIVEGYGKYSGLDRYEARKELVRDLDEQGYLVKIKDHAHNVGTHDRCGSTIEPMTSEQWYVKMKPLAEPAIKVVREGEIKFVPERFSKTYYNWMENIQDWCISRQLWWGHRIPVWYCKDCGEVIVSTEDPTKCTKCGSEHLEQDKDVLDTWFSSALWPFSTLGYPEKTEDLEYFYPTNTLVTGYDIIFFWVARMIFSGLHSMKKIPFNTVLIHGIVRDSEGRKMSKSLGNGVDPLEVIEKYGADALRFMLITGNAPGNDIRYYEEKVEAARNFANKIWNASRFVMMNLDKDLMDKYKDSKEYTLADKWILSRINTVVKEVTENIEKFEVGIAAQKTYDFMWNEFCDWYIELVKPVLYGEDEKSKGIVLNVLNEVLKKGLKLLHPVMPFITEEIYTNLPNAEETIVTSAWPVYSEELSDSKTEEQMNYIIEAIKSLRNVRAEMNVPPSRKAKVAIYATEGRDAFEEGKVYFEKLASASEVVFIDSKEDAPENSVAAVTKGAEMFMPLLDLVDVEKELERLNKEKEKLQKEIERVEKKLSNEKFVSKAPEAVVNEEKEKGKKYKEMYEAVLQRIDSLK
ncbi:valine--tRNA ligase [Clostridium botulinum]|uniref:Valine--tRNA ligase n=1 Tax=Clostridium botulinum C/D str. DC5 TaxID=1443128 RepID=A0A0A0IG20_CLOBO|nr:valine--tRNA ligase [Clostridium botulinum]KEI04741.1 valyl-tRNA synthetase [Clostridium botulinum C/D str. BKT75002]KEI09513.1 valyl-tRNA synthetase [Clostridium botulinum C/D str. BKT2873]KGM94308.1 valyl-tRNA synthetase [Clostridium botulinum D str. CCUG 7971]KGM99503.1 valyl-tRNA synthetase [Clostridium botulinum C/D str. DC5]KOC47590.1 valyl-tRNA synthetase [Clostridium botulinum]